MLEGQFQCYLATTYRVEAAVGSEKLGPDEQRTDGIDDGRTDGKLSTPETQRWVTWADVVKISKNSKFKKEKLVIGIKIIS